MNQVFWVNQLSIWFNDSLLNESSVLSESIEYMIQWLIAEWIKCSEWINWVDDSMTFCWMNRVFWVNQLSIWFNDSLLNESSVLSKSIEYMIQWLVAEWIKCSEWINWVDDSMTCCWMNQVFWVNQLSRWFNDSLLNELNGVRAWSKWTLCLYSLHFSLEDS